MLATIEAPTVVANPVRWLFAPARQVYQQRSFDSAGSFPKAASPAGCVVDQALPP